MEAIITASAWLAIPLYSPGGGQAYCAGKDVVMPAMAKILIVFAGMLVLARVRVPLGLVLAYGFGYMGMMLSPVHLCFLVTREYFGARMLDVYRAITPCIISVAVYALLAHGLLSALHW